MATTFPIPPSVRPLPEVPGVTHRYVDAGGLRMHVAEAGAGEPVLLVHGWPQHWYLWRKVMPALATRYRVIAPDLRGLGWTEAPRDGYEKEQLASDLLALLDALQLPRVKLIGHDWGGWAGFLMCLRAPQRIEKFIALNIPHPFQRMSPGLLAASWRFWYQWVLATPGLGAWLMRRGFVGQVLRRSLANRKSMSAAEIAEFDRACREPGPVHATTQIYRSFTLREVLQVSRGRYRGQRLRVPTRLLFGVADVAIDRRMLDGAQAHSDDFAVELVEGCGHFIVDEKPERVVERALQWFG
ncbi:MAG TPA: alpha/beta hydrolase [Solimonas sp.]|nr:alpha/beta hydrolase [Solimonas sp.]